MDRDDKRECDFTYLLNCNEGLKFFDAIQISQHGEVPGIDEVCEGSVDEELHLIILSDT